jgi:hypothetical protein
MDGNPPKSIKLPLFDKNEVAEDSYFVVTSMMQIFHRFNGRWSQEVILGKKKKNKNKKITKIQPLLVIMVNPKLVGSKIISKSECLSLADHGL